MLGGQVVLPILEKACSALALVSGAVALAVDSVGSRARGCFAGFFHGSDRSLCAGADGVMVTRPDP